MQLQYVAGRLDPRRESASHNLSLDGPRRGGTVIGVRLYYSNTTKTKAGKGWGGRGGGGFGVWGGGGVASPN